MKERPKNERGISLVELQIAAFISIIVGGISFFTLFRSQSAYNLGEKMADLHYRARQSMDRMSEDIRLAGYGVDAGGLAILQAKRKEMTMLSDLDDDGDIDTVHFYLSDPNGLQSTPNPNDRILYKSMNGSSPGAQLGFSFTKIMFGFYDESGNDLVFYGGPDPYVQAEKLMEIRLITIELTAAMPKPDKDGTYRSLELKSSINPRNLILLANN